MRHSLEDVVRRALDVLDDYGLADLSMRRLAAELGLQPSALYHHVASKQVLLALLADEVLRRGARELPADLAWDERLSQICLTLRDAMLAWRDGAELVSTVYAFGLGATAPYRDLVLTLRDAGFDAELATAGARTLLYVTFGHTGAAQTHLQAASAGAIDAPVEDPAYAGHPGPADHDGDPGHPGPAGHGGDDLAAGLQLIVAGLRERLPAQR